MLPSNVVVAGAWLLHVARWLHGRELLACLAIAGINAAGGIATTGAIARCTGIADRHVRTILAELRALQVVRRHGSGDRDPQGWHELNHELEPIERSLLARGRKPLSSDHGGPALERTELGPREAYPSAQARTTEGRAPAPTPYGVKTMDGSPSLPTPPSGEAAPPAPRGGMDLESRFPESSEVMRLARSFRCVNSRAVALRYLGALCAAGAATDDELRRYLLVARKDPTLGDKFAAYPLAVAATPERWHTWLEEDRRQVAFVRRHAAGVDKLPAPGARRSGTIPHAPDETPPDRGLLARVVEVIQRGGGRVARPAVAS